MSDTDEKRAAERLRSLVPDELWKKAGPHWTQEDKDLWICAGAYIRDHPADDAEPLKNSWLDQYFDYECGLGWSVGKLFVRHDAMSREWIVYARDHEYGQSIEVAVIFTRGDVRRLCRALGVKLKEQS